MGSTEGAARFRRITKKRTHGKSKTEQKDWTKRPRLQPVSNQQKQGGMGKPEFNRVAAKTNR